MGPMGLQWGRAAVVPRLVAARQAQEAAELRAQEAAREAELQLQALRRQLEVGGGTVRGDGG